MVFKTPQDIVDSFHEMTTSILHTIEIAKNTDLLELSMVSELEKKLFFYNDTYLSFSDYISALKDDTQSKKAFYLFFSSNIPSKITSQRELKPHLRTILNAIKSTILKLSKEYNNILDFIKKKREFDISPSSVINMFHVLINYARDAHKFNTLELIDGVWPDLRQKIITKSIDVANYLNVISPSQNITRPNITRPNITRPNITRPNITRPNITRRNIQKRNVPQNNVQKIYPFGAPSTRKRRRV